MPQTPIKRAIEKLPGGMKVTPLLLGALITTFLPETQKDVGAFAGALFNGALTILAVFSVCMGASIDCKAPPYVVKNGATLFLVKIGMGMVLGIIFGRILGEVPVSSGVFAGLSTLAIVAAMNDTNGGLYMALMGQYGRPRDVGAGLDLTRIRQAGLLGLALGVAGAAAASPTGNAAAVPGIAAAANTASADAVDPATVLVAATLVVTALLIPLVTAWTARTFVRPAEDGAEDGIHADSSISTVPAGIPGGH